VRSVAGTLARPIAPDLSNVFWRRTGRSLKFGALALADGIITWSVVCWRVMSDVTRILSAIEHGDPHACEQLLPLVYDELCKLAAHRLAQEKPGQTLQATALVHEAYLRLLGADGAKSWDGRGHFFAAAAEAMGRILVDNARRKASLKRGGAGKRVPLGDLAITPASEIDDLLSVNEALDELAKIDPQAAELVKLRYFAGLTTEQAAELLGMSARSAYYTWTYARAWLRRAMQGTSQS
jgi:RNA polymerase sigma factor (TIGR02999 family)